MEGSNEFTKYDESKDVATAKCEVRPPSFWQYLSSSSDSSSSTDDSKNGISKSDHFKNLIHQFAHSSKKEIVKATSVTKDQQILKPKTTPLLSNLKKPTLVPIFPLFFLIYFQENLLCHLQKT